MAPPDPKGGKRVKDHDLLAALHLKWPSCFLYDTDCLGKLELHHVHNKPRDDVQANLVMLCMFHHALITANHPRTWRLLRDELTMRRPDVREYLARKLGGNVAARAWFDRYTSERVVRPVDRAP